MKKNKLKIGEFREGTVELGREELDDANTKVRITTFLDGTTLQKFRKFAQLTNGKYQSLLNECLNSYAEKFLDQKLKEIKRGIHSLEKKKA
jgi:hypothetical protein